MEGSFLIYVVMVLSPVFMQRVSTLGLSETFC